MNIKDLDTQWEDFVNSFLFANYENLSVWVAKRGVSNSGLIFNYIDFPIPENGKILTKYFLDYIIQSIENDENLCKQFFGPAYEPNSAKIFYGEDEEDSLVIIWNIKNYDDNILNNSEQFNELYHWPIYHGQNK